MPEHETDDPVDAVDPVDPVDPADPPDPADPTDPPDPADPGDPTDQIVIPALLRAARGSYGSAIADRLEAAGIDDLPRHGAFVLGGMANHGGSAADMIGALEISKQRASQLVDTLVLRGYLMREVNAEDRRRTTILLTDRGRAAASEVRSAVDQIDAELAQELSATELAGLRKGLTALALIRERRAVGRTG